MKISCQYTRQDLSVPHKWFAWYPITFVCEGRRYFVWLSYVTRYTYDYGYYDAKGWAYQP